MSRADRRAKQRATLKRQEQLKTRGRRTAPLLSRKATTIIIASVLAAVVIVVGGFWYLGYRKGSVVLKTVNGQNITQHDVTKQGNLTRFLYGLSTPLDAATEKAVLDTMVDDVLLREEAVKRSITVTDQEVADLEAQWATALQTVYKGTVQVTVARLRLGVGQADLKTYEETQILVQKLYDEVTKEITAASITEADIQAMYAEEKSTLDSQGLSLEQARDTLTQDALNKKRGDTYTKFLDDLRSRATITGPGLPG